MLAWDVLLWVIFAILVAGITFGRSTSLESRWSLASIDPGVYCGQYTIPFSLSRVYDVLNRFIPSQRHIQINPVSPVEFILCADRPILLGVFRPYYRLTIDESRVGAQVKISRKIRLEALGILLLVMTALSMEGFFQSVWNHLSLYQYPLQIKPYLWSGILAGVGAVLLLDITLRQTYRDLLFALGVYSNRYHPDGGEPQAWVIH